MKVVEFKISRMYMILSLTFSFFSYSAPFKPALESFDSSFISNIVANAALRSYNDAEYGLRDFDYGANSISSSEVFLGDPDKRVWEKKSFSGNLSGRHDVWGSVYKYENKVVIAFHGSHWIVDWLQDIKASHGLSWLVDWIQGFKEKRDLSSELFAKFKGNIHPGFAQVVGCFFSNMEDSLISSLSQFQETRSRSQKYPNIKNIEFIFTGHSLGGALANLSGVLFASKNKTEL